MTIEEKAKAYDEALKRAIKHHNKDGLTLEQYETIDIIFPELKENEDEKIRKAIHIYLDWLDGHKDYQPKGDYTIKDMIAWLEKQGNESVNIDIESMVSSYEQRVVSQSNGVRNNPLVNMCVSAFRHGIENTLEELNLKKLEKQDEKPVIEMKSPEESLGISSKEYNDIVNDCLYGEQKPTNSYCQEHCKGYQETGKCFADGDCRDKREAERKSTWSEDDEDLLFWTINNLTELKNRYGKNYGKTGKCITWLKTLKERIGG